MPDSWIGDTKLHSAEEWYGIFKKAIDTQNFELSDDVLNQFDLDAVYENEKNFDTMLRGEIVHKIFELLIKNPENTKNRKDLIFQKILELIDEFKIKYGDKYKEVPTSLNVIDTLLNGNNDYPSLQSVFDSYYNEAIEAKKKIESSFIKDNENSQITWLAEQRITANLDKPLNGKSKIRGKIDVILVIDGIPHIIDLKVSRSPISEWASEKILKTNYQLAMYWRLLGKIGLPANNTSLNIYSIPLNKDQKANSGTLKNVSDIKADTTINKNLSESFNNVIQTQNLDYKNFEQMDDYVTKLFGNGSVKGQKKANIEHIKENLINSAKSAIANKKTSFKYNIPSDTGTGTERVTVQWDSKESMDAEIDKLAHIIADRIEGKFNNIYDALAEDLNQYFTRTDKDISTFTSVDKNSDMINQMSAILIKYKGVGAKLMYPELGKKYNLFFIETPIGIDIICASSLNPNIPYDATNRKATLFSNNSGIIGDDNMKTIGNIEIVKALLIANQLLLGTTKKIGTITCIQLGRPAGYTMTTANMKKNIDIATSIVQTQNNLTSGRFTDPLANVLFTINQFIGNISGMEQVGASIKPSNIEALDDQDKFDLLKLVLSKKTDIDIIKGVASDLSNNKQVTILEAIRASLKANYPTLFEKPDVKIVCPETVLMNMIEQAIAIYQGREMVCETDISKLGFLSGAMWASMDLIPSQNIQIIRSIIDASFSKVREIFADYKSGCRAQVAKLKTVNDFGSVRQFTIGDVSSIYYNLYRRNADKTLEDDDYILKNPWSDHSLNETERNFIKYMLFNINKYDSVKKKYKWKTWKDVKEDQFEKIDYYIPLVRNRGLDRFRDPKGGLNAPSIKSMWDSAKNKGIQMKDTLEGQIEDRKRASDLFQSVYNEFENRKDINIRKELIEKNGLKSFSIDLETTLDMFTITMESKNIFDLEVIPAVKSALYATQFQAFITGKELPNFQEFVKMYTKNVIYNDSVMEPEWQKAYKVIAPLKSASSMIALGFNFMNAPREVLMGFFTNIRSAMFGAYGKETFTGAEYIKSMGIMSGDIPNFIANVTKIELLNEYFGMANMSITEIPEQATSNKTGAFALFNRFMSWSLTAPDYWNRMSMFIAQMIHDGCWDAYVLEKDAEGVQKLKYDMSKDKRFEVYIKYKADYNKVPNNLKSTFNYQESLYNIMREDLNKELPLNKQIEPPKPGNVPQLYKAYTNKQRDSFKSFADMSFGYYDKETKAWFFKTAIGGIFKQFMAYLSAKKMSYFQVRSSQTARGSYQQLTDSAGNKLWSIAINNSPLEMRIVSDKDLNGAYKQFAADAKPKLGWTGSYMEGIINSYANLFKDLGVGTYDAFRGKGTDEFKKLWKEYGKKGDIRHSNMLQGLYDLLLSTMFIRLLRMWFFDDPTVTGVSYDSQLKQAGGMFQNMYWMADQATQDFSLYNLITNGIFTWEFPTFGIFSNMSRKFMKAAGDDDLNISEALLSGTVNSIGMFRPIRPTVNAMLDQDR